MGYDELGCQGNPQIPTPHIDSLAKTGVRCTAGYVTASYCSASRAGMLTGRYQTRFGHEHNPIGAANFDPASGLPLTERTLAERLQVAGYVTGLVGKWHLGAAEEYQPPRRGFDEFYGFLHEGHFYVPGPPWQGVTSFLRRKALPAGPAGRLIEGTTIWSNHTGGDEPPYDERNPILRSSKPIEEPAYLTDALTREATAFIDRHQREPFFLYVAYNAVHSPMQGAEAYMHKFAHLPDMHRRVFAAMLANLDDSVGAILQKLRDVGLEDNTLVLFLSDNGGPTRELTSSNLPLRGGKGELYEGGVRVPFLVRWPGVLPAGRAYDRPVSATDILPTACAAAAVSLAAEEKLDGVDLRPFLSGQKAVAPHEMLYWRMGDRAALRAGDWKLVGQGAASSNVRFELYDLAADISETNDLAARRPELLVQLRGKWNELNAQMVESRVRRGR